MHIPSTLSPHPTFDRVPEENYPNPWPRWREKKFQKELDRLAGVASNGRSNLRLLWPADADESLSMELIAGEKKARYRLYTTSYRCTSVSEAGLELIQDIDVDICTPRYVIEEYHPPSEEAFGNFKAPSKGNGYYSHLFTVAHHDEKCCGGTEGIKGELCLGLYREPGQADLSNVQRMLRARDTMEHGHAPGTQASDAEVRAEARLYRRMEQHAIEKRRADYAEAAMSGFAPHMHRLFTEDESVLRNGKYHWMSGHNKSGTPQEGIQE
jgi:hypothetical protein